MKKLRLLWSLSLILVGVCAVIVAVFNITEASMPDALKIALGVTELAAAPALIYTTVQLYFKK